MKIGRKMADTISSEDEMKVAGFKFQRFNSLLVVKISSLRRINNEAHREYTFKVTKLSKREKRYLSRFLDFSTNLDCNVKKETIDFGYGIKVLAQICKSTNDKI